MPTIKDIAREAGVSHGTVSNVLNGKENVSAKKILLVKQAAERLGYTMNTGAKSLRRGNSDTLGIVLPNIIHINYLDFYLSFKHYANNHGYTVNLYLSNYNVSTEKQLVKTARSEMCESLATFSCINDGNYQIYDECGYNDSNVVFVERRPNAGYTYIGFDYRLEGSSMAQQAMENGYRSVAVVSANSPQDSCQAEFLEGFMGGIDKSKVEVLLLVTDKLHCYQSFLEFLENHEEIEAIFITSYAYTQAFRSVMGTFYRLRNIEVYSTSPLFTAPKPDAHNYELNYRLMGKTAAQELIEAQDRESFTPRTIRLENDGFRRWKPAKLDEALSPCTLTVLTLDSPTARILESVSGLFTKELGIQVKIEVQGYDKIHQTLSRYNSQMPYDIIRLDHTWLSYFAKEVYMPLEDISPQIADSFSQFMPNVKRRYSKVENRIYCLPETPSSQMLFYRKDLFENLAMKRLYKEQYKEDLLPPTNFEQYNRIARFFTKRYNSYSPVEYGTTLTLGNTGVAATEFLSRYVCQTDSFFDDQTNTFPCTKGAVTAMRQLVEAQNYAPQMHSGWWRDTAQEFANGEVAMTVLFSNFASEILNSQSKVKDNVGFSLAPGGNPLLGGGSVGVTRYSKNPQQALAFIQWICSEPISTFMALLGNVSPCKKTYDNYEVVDTYPWLTLSKESIEISRISRTPVNFRGRFDEREFLNLIGQAVLDCCNNKLDEEVALQRVSRLFGSVLRPYDDD